MLKLKKAALSLFGLAVVLICINPPQAHAGVVVAIGGPVYPRPVYVRPYYVAPPYVAYAPRPYANGPVFVRPGFGYPGYYRPATGVRGDSNIASLLCVAPTGVAKKFQVT